MTVSQTVSNRTDLLNHPETPQLSLTKLFPLPAACAGADRAAATMSWEPCSSAASLARTSNCPCPDDDTEGYSFVQVSCASRPDNHHLLVLRVALHRPLRSAGRRPLHHRRSQSESWDKCCGGRQPQYREAISLCLHVPTRRRLRRSGPAMAVAGPAQT